MAFSTGFTAITLSFIHPWLPVLLSFDVLLLLHAFKTLNQTTNLIILDNYKRHVHLNKLNFLGFKRKESPKRIPLKRMLFLGKYHNKGLSLNNLGLLPSISYFMNYGNQDSFPELDKTKQKNSQQDEKNTENKNGNFEHFYKFMADNETFLVAVDHPDFGEHCPSHTLLMNVLKSQQRAI